MIATDKSEQVHRTPRRGTRAMQRQQRPTYDSNLSNCGAPRSATRNGGHAAACGGAQRTAPSALSHASRSGGSRPLIVGLRYIAASACHAAGCRKNCSTNSCVVVDSITGCLCSLHVCAVLVRPAAGKKCSTRLPLLGVVVWC